MTDIATLRIIIDGSGAQGQAARITADLNRMGDAGGRAERAMGSLGGALGGFARLAGLAATAVGGIGFGRIISETATYERQLSSLQAVSQASTAEMQRFSEAARQLGATTAFSATEAAAGMEALASAGQNTTQVLQSIRPALSLAAAGSLELKDAAELGAATLNQFGLSADNFQRVADTLAQGAATGATSVAQLGQALGNTGKTASDAGFSLERTVAILTALSDSNIKAAESGTAFRGVIASVLAPAGDAEDILARLGANAGTADERLQKLAQAGLSDAEMFKVFGREGKEAASVILDSIPKIDRYTDELNNATGAVDRMAATMQDNLVGDAKAAASALSELALQVGLNSGLNAGLRGMVQNFTEVITKINQFPKADFFNEHKTQWRNALAVPLGDFGNELDKAIKKLDGFADSVLEIGAKGESVFDNLPIKVATALVNINANFSKFEAHVKAAWELAGEAAATELTLMAAIAAEVASFLRTQLVGAIDAVRDAWRSMISEETRQNVELFSSNVVESLAGAAQEITSVFGALPNTVSNFFGEIANDLEKSNEGLKQTSEFVTNASGAYSQLATAISERAKGEVRLAEDLRSRQLAELGVVQTQNELRQSGDALMRIHDRAAEAQNKAATSAKTYAEMTEKVTEATESSSGAVDHAIRPTRSYGSAVTDIAKQSREAARGQSDLAREVDRVRSSYESGVASLEKQIALYGNISREAEARYDIEIDRLREIDPMLADHYLQLSRILDQKDALTEAAEAHKRAEEDAAQETLRAWQFVGDKLEDLFASVWDALIDGSKSVGEALLDWFKGLLSQLAAIAVRNAIIVPIVGQFIGTNAATQLFGGGPNFGSLLNGGGSLFGGVPSGYSPGTGGFGSAGNTGFGSLFGGSSISNGLNSYLGTSFAVSNIGLLGAGIFGGFVGDQVFGGQYGGTGGSIGASAGALYGSAIMPGIGTVIGAVLGALAGGALGSLFGGDYEPYPYQLVQVGGGGIPIGDSSNITRTAPVTGASGLIFEAVSKHVDIAGAENLRDELLALDAILASVAPNANLAGKNLGDFGATLDGILAGLDGYQDADTDVVAKFVKEWLLAAEELNERARDIVLEMEGTGRELAASFVGISQLMAYSETSPLADFQKMLEATQVSAWDAAAAQRDYVVELMSSFDGTPEQIATLADAVAKRYEMELALVAQIMTMIEGVQAIGQSAVERMQLATMTDEQRYGYFTTLADSIRDSIAGLTDPQEIMDAFQRAIAAQQSAFDLLDQDQKRAVLGEFVNWTETLQQQVEQMLGDAAAQIENENAALGAIIEQAFNGPSNDMKDAAADIRQAADTLTNFLQNGIPVQQVIVYINEGESQLGYG